MVCCCFCMCVCESECQRASDCLLCTCTMAKRCRCNMVLYYFINTFCFAFVNVYCAHCSLLTERPQPASAPHSKSRTQERVEKVPFFFSLKIRFFCYFDSATVLCVEESGVAYIFDVERRWYRSTHSTRFHLHNHFNQFNSNGSTRVLERHGPNRHTAPLPRRTVNGWIDERELS